MAADSKALKRLADIFRPRASLYAVGGYVRDSLLGFKPGDVDVCSSLEPEAVRELLQGSGFTVIPKSLRMGTLIIVSGSFKCEYTTFRVDSYRSSSGAHAPIDVRFTDNIAEDARRRDFTVNAIYYDISADKYVDPTGGLSDLQARMLKAADKPDKVFGEDGLRILRLVRFAAELNFDIEENTLDAAKTNTPLILDISVERIREELNRIFLADTARGIVNAHYRGIGLLDRLGLIRLLLPELETLRGLKQPVKYHRYDAFEHSLHAFEASAADLSVRWAALLHDVGKAEAVAKFGNMHGHAEISAQLTEKRLSALKFPKALKSEITELVALHMTDINGNMSEAKMRLFTARHYHIAEKLALLMDADAAASSGEAPDCNRVRETMLMLKADNTPLSLKELSVGGKELMELGANEKDRGRLLDELWRDTVLNPALNNRESALSYLRKKIGK